MKKSLAAVAVALLTLLGIGLTPTAAFAAGSVTVTVADGAAAPILGAQVSALTANGGVTLSPVIGVPGAYMNSNLSAGTYTILVTAPGYARQFFDGTAVRGSATPVVVTEGGSQTLAVTLDPESVISGTITDHLGQPYRALVALYSDNDGGSAIASAFSDTVTGAYSFGSLAHGDYRVAVQTPSTSTEASQWYVQANSFADATVVALTTPSATVDIQLAEAGVLAGSTTNALGTPVDVEISGTPWGFAASSNGAYSVGGLLPDTYTFSAQDSIDFFAPATAGPLAITGGVTTPHDFVLTPRLLDEATMLGQSAEVSPISGPSTVEAGGTYTWLVTPPDDSDLYAVLYSDPVLLGVIANSSSTSATITVTIPASTPAGAHRFAVWTYDDGGTNGFPDADRVWFPLEVTAARLAATGVDGTGPLLVGLGLLVAGLGGTVMVRRRPVR